MPAKRLASGALCLCMLLALLAGFALAAPVQVLGAAVQNGTGNFVVNTTVIGFGGKEWYVIGYDGAGVYSTVADGHATLFLKSNSTEGYGTSVFRETAQLGESYVNHYTGSSTLPSPDSALQIAMAAAANSLSTMEKALITDRTLTAALSVMGGGDATVTFWPLSSSEGTTMGRALIAAYDMDWWTRTYGPYDSVNVGNLLNQTTEGVAAPANNTNAIRPAFSLNLANVMLTSAANGAGTKATSAVGSTLDSVSAPSGAIKLTAFDSGLTFSAAPSITALDGRTLTFSYTPSAAGGSTYNALSAVVRDSANNVKYYGRLSVTPPSTGTSGSASVTVPDGFAAGDVLSVFIEQVNGDNLTDFASALVSLSFTNQVAPAGLGSTAETAALNDGTITGLTSTLNYEYKLANASTWTAFTGSTEITGLAGGSYQVRLAASALSIIASPATAVSVTAYHAPTPAPTTGTPQSTGSPQTGDSGNLPLWALCGGVALAGLAGCGAALRRRFGRNSFSAGK